jgi:hypothetical protein
VVCSVTNLKYKAVIFPFLAHKLELGISSVNARWKMLSVIMVAEIRAEFQM